MELHWNQDLEPKKKRPKEQDFLENTNNNANNNSQMSSLDFFQPRSVSTGLGLSLDNNSNGRLASSGDSAFLGFVGDDIDRELQRQDAEIDRYIKIQVFFLFFILFFFIDTSKLEKSELFQLVNNHLSI